MLAGAMTNPGLRDLLGAITRTEDVGSHAERIRAIVGHSIRLVSDGDAWVPTATDYNCFGFAFGLTDSAKYTAIASRFGHICADSEFVTYLLANGVLAEVPEGSGDAGVILYFNDNKPTHAGRLRGSRVVSKWGVGPLWEHETLEVPAQYGGSVRYFRALTPAAAYDAFEKYARIRRIEPERLPAGRSAPRD